jgi:hypothetical protein
MENHSLPRMLLGRSQTNTTRSSKKMDLTFGLTYAKVLGSEPSFPA